MGSCAFVARPVTSKGLLPIAVRSGEFAFLLNALSRLRNFFKEKLRIGLYSNKNQRHEGAVTILTVGNRAKHDGLSLCH
jgi:hypothetical protein